MHRSILFNYYFNLFNLLFLLKSVSSFFTNQKFVCIPPTSFSLVYPPTSRTRTRDREPLPKGIRRIR